MISRILFMALLCLPACSTARAEKLPTYDAYDTGEVYDGPHARPVLASPDARSYRTRLIEGAKQVSNFASHFRMVTWGCGTSCATGAAVDSLSGNVVFIPFSICCYAGPMDTPDWDSIQYRAESSLVVFHGQRNEEGINGDHYYIFDGKSFRFIATKEVKEAVDSAPSPPPATDQSPGVKTCQKIADGNARLKCYDAVLNYAR